MTKPHPRLSRVTEFTRLSLRARKLRYCMRVGYNWYRVVHDEIRFPMIWRVENYDGWSVDQAFNRTGLPGRTGLGTMRQRRSTGYTQIREYFVRQRQHKR